MIKLIFERKFNCWGFLSQFSEELQKAFLFTCLIITTIRIIITTTTIKGVILFTVVFTWLMLLFSFHTAVSFASCLSAPPQLQRDIVRHSFSSPLIMIIIPCDNDHHHCPVEDIFWRSWSFYPISSPTLKYLSSSHWTFCQMMFKHARKASIGAGINMQDPKLDTFLMQE